MESDLHELTCRIRRSIRYHRTRERFFRRWASAIAFISLVSGFSIVAAILAEVQGYFALTAGAVVAFTQAAEMAFGISAKASTHNGLAVEFAALEAAMARVPDHDEAACRRFLEDTLRIEMREPPIKRYLDLICHNQVARAMGSDDVESLIWWQRWFAQYLAGDSTMEMLGNRRPAT